MKVEDNHKAVIVTNRIGFLQCDLDLHIVEIIATATDVTWRVKLPTEK